MKSEPKRRSMKQLVYRHEFIEPMAAPAIKDAEFAILSASSAIVGLWHPLFRCLGFPGLIKAGLKLATKKRRLYCVLASGCVAHYGWVSFSFCRYYQVNAGDVVIGPIMTDDRFRGRGYATLALMRVMNALMAEGCRVFWIDTSEDNIPCRKVIEKCGFGSPVESYERPENALR